MVTAQRPEEQPAPPWQGWPTESRHAPVEPAGVSCVPAGHWHVLDAASHTEPVGCVQLHESRPTSEDAAPGGQAVHPGACPVGLKKLGLQKQVPAESLEP